MADLKNEMMWSRTRVSTLHECKRQYYYNYYLKWNGWLRSAPEPSRVAYRFTKMSSLPMLVGDAVHRTIKKLLQQKQQYGRFTLEEPGLYARKEILTLRLKDALAERWRENPKRHPPLFEIYYGSPPAKSKLKEMGAKTSRCIEAFIESDLGRELQAEDPRGWLAVDPGFGEAPELLLDGRKIAAFPDFARRMADGTVEVWDWKTGRPSPHDELQLLSYALYAQKHWMVGPEQIRLKAFYLDPESADYGIKDYPSTDTDFERIRNVIREDFQTMDNMLVDTDENVPHPMESHFPQIEDGRSCQRCHFKELCLR